MKKVLLLIMTIALFSSCSKQPKDAKYSVKKGMVTYLANMFGTKYLIYLRFTDYGKKRYSETKNGNTVQTLVYELNEEHYVLDPKKKTGTKTIIPTGSAYDLNFLNLSKTAIDANNIKTAGSEKILDKDCTIYEMKDSKTGVSSKVWIWKGIMLKNEGAINNLTYSYTATNIDLEATITDNMFQLPAGYNIKAQ